MACTRWGKKEHVERVNVWAEHLGLAARFTDGKYVMDETLEPWIVTEYASDEENVVLP